MKENRKVPFRDTAIRVLRNHDGMLYISADDVCGILKREEMLKKGDIARICPSAIRMPLRKGGHELWTFRPSDMRRLLQSVRKESILPRDLFDDLEAWGNRLFELEARHLHPQRQADTVCHIAEDFPVTFRQAGDKLMVNATQITMRYGKIPSEWLRIAATDHLRRELARTGQTDRYEFQLFTTRGRGNGATWIEAPLLVPLARWIAPDTGLAEWCVEKIGMLTAGRVLRKTVQYPAEAVEPPCLNHPVPED
ncbi:DNA-binding protein, partial [Parabacteroides merdae]|nr:DNA-binding protein [Parabacteroides merdae]